MVDAGKITRRDMETRLGEMSRLMDEQRRAARAEYAEVEGRLQGMLDDGEITTDQMEQRLNRLKSRLFPGAADQARREARARYAEAADRLQEMVDSGEITAEQMEQRLNRLKMSMFSAADAVDERPRGRRRGLPTPPEGASPAELREWYAGIQARLELAVETGRMTEAEADRMLGEIRSSLR